MGAPLEIPCFFWEFARDQIKMKLSPIKKRRETRVIYLTNNFFCLLNLCAQERWYDSPWHMQITYGIFAMNYLQTTRHWRNITDTNYKCSNTIESQWEPQREISLSKRPHAITSRSKLMWDFCLLLKEIILSIFSLECIEFFNFSIHMAKLCDSENVVKHFSCPFVAFLISKTISQ